MCLIILFFLVLLALSFFYRQREDEMDHTHQPHQHTHKHFPTCYFMYRCKNALWNGLRIVSFTNFFFFAGCPRD